MHDIFDLDDQVIVITGGGGVLCGSMAVALAEAGARIAILDLDEQAAARVANTIKGSDGAAIAIGCDVLDLEQLRRARCRVTEEWRPADALINGAGGNTKNATTGPDLTFFDLPAEALRSVFELNVLGTFLPTQVFGRDMAERGQGAIINIASMTALRPLTNVPAYSAAKAAIGNFTQWLATYMCQHYSPRVRVNALAPGFFLSEQNRFLLTDESTGELTARGEAVIAHTPMRRFGAPFDLVGAVSWLLSGASSFVTGVVLPVDGGFSAYGGV